jgi:four helix bundle protein
VNIQNSRGLVAWQRAMELVVDCYRVSKRFPADERFSLMSQLRRAAVSVPSNIAEGKGRGFNRAYVNHLTIASGSLCELATQLEIACRLRYIEQQELSSMNVRIEEVGRLVTALRKSVESKLD